MVDDKKIEEILDPRHLPLPARPKVSRIRFRHHMASSSSSSSSAPYSQPVETLWITVVLDEETLDRDRRWTVLDAIDNVIRDALRKEGFTEFPYIDYLKASELK